MLRRDTSVYVNKEPRVVEIYGAPFSSSPEGALIATRQHTPNQPTHTATHPHTQAVLVFLFFFHLTVVIGA